MRKCALICALVISASLAFGQIAQLDSNSITVTASRSVTLQPDQVIFNIDVSSDVNTTLDQVLAALSGSGISATNFLNVNAITQWIPITPTTPTTTTPTNGTGTVTGLDWTFTLPVAWSRMKDTMATLTALQKSISQQNSALALSFGVSGTQVSPQLLQMQTCSVTDLLSDARAHAQKLANAANLFVGAVLGMSSSTSNGTGPSYPLPYYTYSPVCSVTVKFAVTR